MPAISIIIPNWNGKRFLKACFDAIAQQTFTDQETILVDNGSTDDSIAYTRANYPWVTILDLTENRGFAGGVNAGIAAAHADLLFLLNNDTELDPDCLKHLAEAAKRHPEVGIFATKMLDFKDRTIIDSCGDVMTWTGRSYNRGQLQTDGPEFAHEKTIFGACAGAALYRSTVFARIGGFDEDFFAYLEDVDIDFRALLAGFSCRFIPAARVYHIGSATSGKGSAFGFRQMIKNHFHLITKNFPVNKLVANSGKLLYAELRLQAAAYRQGYGRDYWRGVGQALAQAPAMLRKRRQIQSARVASDEQLEAVIEPTFSFKPIRQALRRQPTR